MTTLLIMYSIGIKLDNKRKRFSFSNSTNPEKPIETVTGRLSVSPWTWSGGQPRKEMGSEREIWQRSPPSHSPSGRVNDCGTSCLRRRTSPWMDCEKTAPTLPLTDSLNGIWICARLNGIGICGSVSEILILGIENGTCGCDIGICSLLTWSETSFQIGSGSSDVSCCYGNETWSGIWSGSWNSCFCCFCGFYGSCCGSGGDYEIWSGCQSKTCVCERVPPPDESCVR